MLVFLKNYYGLTYFQEEEVCEILACSSLALKALPHMRGSMWWMVARVVNHAPHLPLPSHKVVSSTVLAAALGCGLCGLPMQRYGRRIILYITTILYAFGAFVVCGSDSIPMLITGRTILGAYGLRSPQYCFFIHSSRAKCCDGQCI